MTSVPLACGCRWSRALSLSIRVSGVQKPECLVFSFSATLFHEARYATDCCTAAAASATTTTTIDACGSSTTASQRQPFSRPENVGPAPCGPGQPCLPDGGCNGPAAWSHGCPLAGCGCWLLVSSSAPPRDSWPQPPPLMQSSATCLPLPSLAQSGRLRFGAVF